MTISNPARGTFTRGRVRKKTTRAIAKKALRQSNQNMELVNSIAKLDSTELTNAPVVRFVELPIPDSSRMTLVSFEGRIEIRQDAQSNDEDNYRVDIIIDRRPSGAILDIEDLYEDGPTAVSPEPECTVMYKYG